MDVGLGWDWGGVAEVGKGIGTRVKGFKPEWNEELIRVGEWSDGWGIADVVIHNHRKWPLFGVGCDGMVKIKGWEAEFNFRNGQD